MLYEAKPYLLLSSSFTCLIAGTVTDYPLLLTAVACILFYTGSVIWMLRSKHRRRDLDPQERREVIRSQFFPLYEWRPFIFLAAGAVFPSIWGEAAIFLSGTLLFTVGVMLLIVRTQYRSRSWRDRLPMTVPSNHNLSDNPYAAVRKDCQGALCDNHELCSSIPLPKSALSESMKLLQHSKPEYVQHHIDNHDMSKGELMGALHALHQKAEDCATWGKTPQPDQT